MLSCFGLLSNDFQFSIYLFLLLTYRQTYMCMYTLHNMFPSLKTAWCIGTWIGERDRFNSCCCQGILFCIKYLHFMSRIPYYLHMQLPQTIFVECCLEIFYIHILCFSLLTAWRTPNK